MALVSRLQGLSRTLKTGFSRKWSYLRPRKYGKLRHAKYSLIHRHQLPTTHAAPVMLQTLLVQRLDVYREISFRFQNTPERGVAFQVATFGRMALYRKCADLNI